jgi:hypothetical protein
MHHASLYIIYTRIFIRYLWNEYPIFNLKVKSRTQQITLKPNIIKVNILIANVSLFIIEHLQSNLNEFTGYGIYIYVENNGLILQKRLQSLKEQMNRKKGEQLIGN